MVPAAVRNQEDSVQLVDTASVLVEAPVSVAQERLWFFTQIAPASPLNNHCTGVKIVGPLDRDALERCFRELFFRHACLRGAFSMTSGRLLLKVSSRVNAPPLRWEALDGAENTDSRLRRMAGEAARQAFDLAQGPLLRGQCLRLADDSHVLLLSAPAIVADESSLNLLAEDLATLYAGLVTGQDLPVSSASPEYSDFLRWQGGWLQSGQPEAHLAYWRERMESAAFGLELPTDRARPAIKTYQGAKHSFLISPELRHALENLGLSQEATLDGVLLAAFIALLHRYTGQEDIVLGLPKDLRPGEAFAGVVGCFSNSLPMRVAVSGHLDFPALLSNVRESLRGAEAHADYPFELLAKALQPGRDLSHAPLYHVMFECQSGTKESLICGNTMLSPLDVEPGRARCDLALVVQNRADGINASFEYDTALFEAATVSRMAEHFINLLSALKQLSGQRIGDIAILSEAERHLLLEEWNNTQADYPKETNIASLFDLQAAKTPNAIAAIHGDETISFKALQRKANQLAHHLQTLGVGHETLVGVCMERSIDLFVVVLGINKAGGCYVPLDPIYPRERLGYMIEDAGPSIILAQQKQLEKLPSHLQILALDTGWSQVSRQSTENPKYFTTETSLAYVVFTSGSTGRPKGVAVEQRQLLNRFAWMWREYPFAPGEVCSLKTSINFVDSLWELLGPLLQGIPTVVIADDEVRDPGRLVSVLERHQVTRIMLVPSLLRMLLDTGDNVQHRLAKLTLWCIGGEALTMELGLRFLRAMPHATMLNLYGLSETFDVCCHDTRRLREDDPLAPIGRPISNVVTYILDADLRPVPIGVAGDLYVGGAGLARGYVNQPALTQERFIANPFSYDPAARIYKTGDLARYLADGEIQYLGRRDYQVKIRGFRVETGEIEALLLQHPAVRQAVVVAREAAPGDTRLAAYVVPSSEPAPKASELRAFVKDKLPDYMVPTAFMFLDALPLTSSGKIHRLSLPAPDFTRPDLEVAYCPPQNDEERKIASVWQSLLGVEQVGVNDNFFDLGGHSILLVQVRLRLQEMFQREIPLVLMYAHPTIGSLAKYLGGSQSTGSDSNQAGQGRAETRRALMGKRRNAALGNKT